MANSLPSCQSPAAGRLIAFGFLAPCSLIPGDACPFGITKGQKTCAVTRSLIVWGTLVSGCGSAVQAAPELHIGLRTGYCGSLTTFASWEYSLVTGLIGGVMPCQCMAPSVSCGLHCSSMDSEALCQAHMRISLLHQAMIQDLKDVAKKDVESS